MRRMALDPLAMEVPTATVDRRITIGMRVQSMARRHPRPRLQFGRGHPLPTRPIDTDLRAVGECEDKYYGLPVNLIDD